MTTGRILFSPYQFFPVCLYPPLAWSSILLQKALLFKKRSLAALSTHIDLHTMACQPIHSCIYSVHSGELPARLLTRSY